MPNLPVEPLSTPDAEQPSVAQKVIDRLLGTHGVERYQLWPERLVRAAVSAPSEVMQEGTLPPGLRRTDFTDRPAPGGLTVAASPADPLIGKALDVAALAGTGGLAGTAETGLPVAPLLFRSNAARTGMDLMSDSSKPGAAIMSNANRVPFKRFDENGVPFYSMRNEAGEEVAKAVMGPNNKYVKDVNVNPEYRRQGLASDLYNYIEKDLGYKLQKSPEYLSSEGRQFWENRKLNNNNQKNNVPSKDDRTNSLFEQLDNEIEDNYRGSYKLSDGRSLEDGIYQNNISAEDMKYLPSRLKSITKQLLKERENDFENER